MMEETVQVPVAWLRELMGLGEKIEVHAVTAKSIKNLAELKGYIKSAESFLPNELAQ